MIPNGSITVSSRRILLIENSSSDRQLLRNWLNAEMIETYEAIDIITAMAAVQKYAPNLILLQLRLPTWDGFEVIRRLKDDPRTRSIPVILIAASALTAEKAKGIDMGAVDFVSKPFDSVELLARVNSSLRTKALLDLLEQRAHLDGLTELGNRFALQDEFPILFADCRQKESRVSILILDIDHFKRINDHYGHAAGDEVLRRIANVLKESVRPVDFVARYGGEEFVVVCPNSDLQTARETANNIRMKVADLAVGFRNSIIRLTASVGVAGVSMPFNGLPQEVLEKADQSLYRAKASGRNAVWYWDFENQMALESLAGSTAVPSAWAPSRQPRSSLAARALAARRASLPPDEDPSPSKPEPPRPVEAASVTAEIASAWHEPPPPPSPAPAEPPVVVQPRYEHPIPRLFEDRIPPAPHSQQVPFARKDAAPRNRRMGPPPPPPRPRTEPAPTISVSSHTGELPGS